ncbi:MAG: 4Fe-4S binding protein [Chitinispirillaceae bacterium]|jgi:hydrogenase-4 component H|nr:4Fe-4S binding protein [Chitinispirillaceae bacterium]
MSLLSKIKETILCLKAGRVTLSYPLNPRPVPERFRGRPVFDGSKCIGCGGCANNCPAREILLSDKCQEIRVVKYIGRRCTYCGRCADLCPEKAITMSKEFETAHDKPAEIEQNLDIWMGTCQRCGRCFKHEGPLDDLMMKGFRKDDLDGELWVYKSKTFLESAPVTDDIEITTD